MEFLLKMANVMDFVSHLMDLITRFITAGIKMTNVTAIIGRLNCLIGRLKIYKQDIIRMILNKVKL